MMQMTGFADPRAEANALFPDGTDARVLEPSPPAALDARWMADDPTDPAGAAGGLVTPIPGEGTTWAELADADDHVAAFAADHWLDGVRAVPDFPDGHETTRRSLHEVAFFALSPRRYQVTGKMGLRYTHGGFGTPFFRAGTGDDEQIRVEGDHLVRQVGPTVAREAITTPREAARFVGTEFQSRWFEGFNDELSPHPDRVLDVDEAASEAIGHWFGFATHVLELARRTPGAEDVSRVQLWPEHFDVAFEMGSSERARRASYGASPGDDSHPEPYFYVAAWGSIDRSDPYWNDNGFNGGSLTYRELREADDPYSTALAFLADGHRRLTT